MMRSVIYNRYKEQIICIKLEKNTSKIQYLCFLECLSKHNENVW